MSTIRNAPLLDAVLQALSDRPTIRHLPDTLYGVPPAAGLLDLSLQFHLFRGYTDAHQCYASKPERSWRPRDLFDDQLDCCESQATFCIVTVPYTYKLSTILAQ
ncbi:MAG: hypothetical protein ACRERE_28690 [Candidatus Entotheonellia bacterium]